MLNISRMYVTLGDAKIQRARSQWRLHFVPWGPIFVGPQYVSCFKSPFWRLEISGGSWIFGRVLRSCVTPSVYDGMYKDLVSQVNISMSDPRSKYSASRIVANCLRSVNNVWDRADGTTECMSGDKIVVFVTAVSPKVHCAEFVLPGTNCSNKRGNGVT
jgi:hypothetical protein